MTETCADAYAEVPAKVRARIEAAVAESGGEVMVWKLGQRTLAWETFRNGGLVAHAGQHVAPLDPVKLAELDADELVESLAFEVLEWWDAIGGKGARLVWRRIPDLTRDGDRFWVNMRLGIEVDG